MVLGMSALCPRWPTSKHRGQRPSRRSWSLAPAWLSSLHPPTVQRARNIGGDSVGSALGRP